MLYVSSVLTTPEEFIKQLNTIIYNFLWKGTDKIARLAAVNDLKYGGLNLIDLETYVKVTVYLQGCLASKRCSASGLSCRYLNPYIKLKLIELAIKLYQKF